MIHCLCQIFTTVGSFPSIGLLLLETDPAISSSSTNIITKSISLSNDFYLLSALCINRRVAHNPVRSFSLTNSVDAKSDPTFQKIHAISYVHSRSAMMDQMVTSFMSVPASCSENPDSSWATYNTHIIMTLVDQSHCVCNFDQVDANEENTDKNEHASLGDNHFIGNQQRGYDEVAQGSMACCDKMASNVDIYILPVFFPIQFGCIFEICWK